MCVSPLLFTSVRFILIIVTGLFLRTHPAAAITTAAWHGFGAQWHTTRVFSSTSLSAFNILLSFFLILFHNHLLYSGIVDQGFAFLVCLKGFANGERFICLSRFPRPTYIQFPVNL